MKKIIFILCIFILTACNSQKEKENHIRKSLNKYFSKIKLDKDTRKNYELLFDEYNERDYITFLKNENLVNCSSSISDRSATILEHRKKIEAGLPLTENEKEFDKIKHTDIFSNIDDSLSRIKPDETKTYFKVFTFQLKDKDTIWKNNFWMDGDYKIVE